MALQWIIIVLLSFKLSNIHASDGPDPPHQALYKELPASSDEPQNAEPQNADPQYTAKLFKNEQELKQQHPDAKYFVNLVDSQCERTFHLFGNLDQLIDHHIVKYVHENDICPHLNLMLKDFKANINLVGDHIHKWPSKQNATGQIIYVTDNHGSPAEINAENILNTFLLQHVGVSYYKIDSDTSEILPDGDQSHTIPQIFCLWPAADSDESSYIKSIWTILETAKWTWQTTIGLQDAIIRCVEDRMDSTGDDVHKIDARTKQQMLPDRLLVTSLKEAHQ